MTIALTASEIQILAMALSAVLALAILFVFARRLNRGSDPTALAEVLRSQAEMQGRLQALTETFAARQQEFGQTVRDRLDSLTRQIGSSMSEQTRSTHDNLLRLQERLSAIDSAQNNIQRLAGDIVSLQAILSNKQARGAFGQGRMEAILKDQLPPGHYAFQATLSNGTRPDALVTMPGNLPPLVIDAKFPLEAWNGFRAAADSDSRTLAMRGFQQDMLVHLKDVAGKYFLPGETQDIAFLFVPSESIFADLHEHFDAVVQRAHRLRIILVSPSLLMLSLQVIQSVLRDHRMREEAHLIQKEVGEMLVDLARLEERVGKLQAHFGMAQRDLEALSTSAEKVARRGQRIEALDLAAPERPAGPDDPGPSRSRVQSAPALSPIPQAEPGLLRFRMVDED